MELKELKELMELKELKTIVLLSFTALQSWPLLMEESAVFNSFNSSNSFNY